MHHLVSNPSISRVLPCLNLNGEVGSVTSDLNGGVGSVPSREDGEIFYGNDASFQFDMVLNRNK